MIILTFGKCIVDVSKQVATGLNKIMQQAAIIIFFLTGIFQNRLYVYWQPCLFK